MAVAMEVASWRGNAELGGSPGRKKRAWGADAQQLMHLMMGQQLPYSHPSQSELTLDLLGSADPTAATVTTSPTTLPQLSPEFLHLDPEEDSLPLPSGWEKCLDLQTGKLYFVNKSSGVSSYDDPRKQTHARDLYTVEIELQTVVVAAAGAAHEAPLAHEFLGSKKSETESLKGIGCSSSSSGSPPRPRDGCDMPSSSYSKQRWSLQLHQHRHNNNNNNKIGAGTTSGRDDSNLELDLNLAAGGSSSSSRILQHQLGHQLQQEPQAVCTMEMIQNALRRTSERTATTTIKRESTVSRLRLKSSVSSSFSSLTNCTTTITTRSEPSAASPSTSSSSSASSRSGAGGLRPPPSSTTRVCEAESLKVASIVEPGALVMGACKRCLMYVMLNKADPRCPRCDSKVPVEFAPPCKKQRPGLKLGFGCR